MSVLFYINIHLGLRHNKKKRKKKTAVAPIRKNILLEIILNSATADGRNMFVIIIDNHNLKRAIKTTLNIFLCMCK